MAIDDKRILAELKRSPRLRLFFGTPVPLDALSKDYVDKELGFVTTGRATIADIVHYVHDRRNIMLVGPRGTGKSYMARKAVEAIEADPRLGIVATITIQGDPNKPPSDYFDDGIIFTVESGDRGKRVIPDTVKAPFFSGAERTLEAFKFDRDEEGKLKLFKAIAPGVKLRVDRVVVFWDEGNRSSPAMQNAMLSLLAEGIIRRDGVDYVFPPVSCILTRNPDGYDAQSAKMPSPLIDRFAVQLYVYNPDLGTLRDQIAVTWHADLLKDMKTELYSAVDRLRGVAGAGFEKDQPNLTGLLVRLVREFGEEREWRIAKGSAQDRPASRRPAPEVIASAMSELRRLVEKNHDSMLVLQAVAHSESALLRLAFCPDLATVLDDAKVIALVILSTWGDAREPDEKPGMQYLPIRMRRALRQIGVHPAVAHAQRRLGDLTRYGTSIRAFIDMLETLVGASIREAQARFGQAGGGRGATASAYASAPTVLGALHDNLGRLLNHRCEAAFNPDREPAKAQRKTAAMVEIARAILRDPAGSRQLYDRIMGEEQAGADNAAPRQP